MKIKIRQKVSAFLLCIIYFCLVNAVSAQSPHFKNYSVKDGLPSSETYEVFQDSKGFIWIATDRGVSRFDGYTFKTFTTEDGLADNLNFGFYEDYKGRIWMKAYTNKLCYYYKSKFYKIDLKDLPVEYKSIISNSLFVDKSDTLWIGFENGLNYLKIGLNSEKQNQNYKLHPLNIDGYYYVKEVDDNGFIYGVNYLSGTSEKYNGPAACFFSKRTNSFCKKFFAVNPDSPTTRAIKSVKGTYLYSKGPVLMECMPDSIIEYLLGPSAVISLFEDEKDGLWLGDKNKGLYYFPSFRKTKDSKLFLSNLSVSSIIKDHEGGMWFSTLENGLYYAADVNILNYSRNDGLSESKVNCAVFSPGNNLWLGLNNGIVNRYKDGKLAEEYDCNKYSYTTNNIGCLEYVENVGVAVGGLGLYILKEGKKPFIFLNPVTRQNDLFIKRIFPLKNKLLACSSIGTYEIDFTNKKHEMRSEIFSPRPYSMLIDKSGDFYLGTRNGLLQKREQQYLPMLKDEIQCRIDDLKEDTINGYVWAASKSEGLFAIKGNTVLRVNKSNGLISDFCSSLFIDSDNDIWVSSNKGISKIRVKSYTPFMFEIENYNHTNGLISDEVNQVIVNGDSVCIATNEGASVFNKKELMLNNQKPPIYISKFLVGDSSYHLEHSYQLKYDQNFIKISYVGISYKDAGNLNYKYRLNGINASWQFTKSTSVNFTTLPYGDYKFEVMAQNNDGFWSENPASISFTIAPPFWHTWWFRIISVTSILSGIFLFIRYRVRLVEKRADEKTELYQKAAHAEKEKLELYQKATDMEMRFLSSQMNPHFTFNAMNSIQKYILEKDPLSAQKYLAQYTKLIRRVLENNMKKYVKIDEEIEMLELYLEIEATRMDNKFNFEINRDESLEDEEYEIPPMIIQPYVENAIWHGLSNKEGNTGHIFLHFSLENKCIKCIIEDNGIGREEAAKLKVRKEHNSVGMLITSQRLQQLHSDENLRTQIAISDLKDATGKALGTRVVVYLPINA